MKSLSPQRRDMMAVIALVIIVCIAFPLIGSLAESRVLPPNTRTPMPTVVPTSTPEPTPTPEANGELRIGNVTFLREWHLTQRNPTSNL